MKRFVSVLVSLVLSCSVGMSAVSCGNKNDAKNDFSNAVTDTTPDVTPPTNDDVPDDFFDDEEPSGDDSNQTEPELPDVPDVPEVPDTDDSTDTPEPPPPPTPPVTEPEVEPDPIEPPPPPAGGETDDGNDDQETPPPPEEGDSETPKDPIPTPPETNDPAVVDPVAPDAPNADGSTASKPSPVKPPVSDSSEEPETEIVLDIASLIGNVVAFPDFTISYNPSAALRPGAIQIGTKELPAWLIPVSDWNDAGHDYTCSNPAHAAHYLNFDASSYAPFDLGANQAKDLFVKLLEGVSATDTATDSAARVQVALIDGQAVADNATLALSAGKHTATLVATGAHNRQIFINREFTVVAPPTIEVPGGELSTLIYSDTEIDVWQGVTASGYEGDLGYTDNAAQVINRDKAGAYDVTLTVTDVFGQSTSVTRTVIIREYTKADALSLYETMQDQMSKSEWTSSATANYGFKVGKSGSAFESSNHYENDWYTHIYRENKLVNGIAVQTLGFAAKSQYLGKGMFQTGDGTSWAGVNDGAILLSSQNGSVSVKRTDPDYDGEFSYTTPNWIGIGSTNETCSQGILYNFDPTVDQFSSKCTTDLGTKSVQEVQNTYGVDLTKYESIYNLNDATTTDFSVTKDSAGNIMITFGMNASAGNPYLKLLNEAMVERWSASDYKGATVTYVLDSETLTPKSMSVNNEQYHLEVNTQGLKGIDRGGRDCDITQYSYTENFSYTSKATLSSSSTQSKPTITSSGESSFTAVGDTVAARAASWEVQEDGSLIFDDGSCSCADERFTDTGSIGNNAPAVPTFDALTIPSTASDLYNWLTIGVHTGESETFAPAAYRRAGETIWNAITADTDLTVLNAEGAYEIKYYVVKDADNYTYCNRTIEVVVPSYETGTYAFDPDVAVPTVSKANPGKIVAANMTAEEFRKFLSKDVVVENCSMIALMSVIDADGTTHAIDGNLDYAKYLTEGTTFTARYIAFNGGNYVVFDRAMTAVAQVTSIGDGEEGSCVKTEGTKAPEFVFEELGFCKDETSENMYAWLYSGMSVSASDGTELTARPVGIRMLGDAAFTEIQDAAAFDYASFITAAGVYEIRYYAKDAATGNFTYKTRTVTVYDAPVLSVSTDGQLLTQIDGKDYVTYLKHEKGTVQEERAKILEGVTLNGNAADPNDTALSIEGEIDYTENTFSVVKISYVNEYGYRCTVNRVFYVSPYRAAKLDISFEDQSTITANNGKEYVALGLGNKNADAATLRALILKGVTVKDPYGKLTTDDIKIDGAIDFSKTNDFSVVRLSVTNEFGQTTTVSRVFYVRATDAPEIKISLQGQQTITVGGKEYACYYPHEQGTPSQERAKILAGVSVTDDTNSCTVDDIVIEGEIDYTKIGYSAITLTITNKDGASNSVRRYIYVRDYAAPEIGVTLDGQPTFTADNGTDYVYYYEHEQGTAQEERAKILAGVSVSDLYGNYTTDDIDIKGAIDYSKPNAYSKVTLSLTNEFGVTKTVDRYFFVRESEKPSIKVSLDGQKTVNVSDIDYVYYLQSEEGDASAERAKILAGVTIEDPYDSCTTDDIQITGKIDYSKVNQYSYVTLSVTNRYGKTAQITRIFYVKEASAPVLSATTDGQPVFSYNDKDYPAYYGYQKGTAQQERAKILAGVTFTDEYGTLTADDIQIEGEIDYTKPNTFSQIKLTLTNRYGKTSTLWRLIYVYPYSSPSVTIDNAGMETTTISGREFVVYRFDRVPSEADLMKGVTVNGADGLDASRFTIEKDVQLSSERGGMGKVVYTVTHPEDVSKTTKVTRYYYCRNYEVTEMNGDIYRIYDEMERFMDTQTYFMKGLGSSQATMVGELTIYTTIDHKPGEFYMENVSDGPNVLGNETAFGKRMFLKQNGSSWSGKFGEVKNTKNTNPIINRTDGYAVNASAWDGKDTQKSYSDTEFQSNFGRPIAQLFGYKINSSTCSGELKDNGNGTYTITYTFNTTGEAVEGYKAQVKTLSGQTVKSVEYANVAVTFDKNFKVYSYHVNEKYKVTTLSATTENSLDYKYYYNLPDNFTVRTF